MNDVNYHRNIKYNLLCSAVFTVFFWAAFEQAGGSMTIFSEKYTQRILEGNAGFSSARIHTSHRKHGHSTSCQLQARGGPRLHRIPNGLQTSVVQGMAHNNGNGGLRRLDRRTETGTPPRTAGTVPDMVPRVALDIRGLARATWPHNGGDFAPRDRQANIFIYDTLATAKAQMTDLNQRRLFLSHA